MPVARSRYSLALCLLATQAAVADVVNCDMARVVTGSHPGEACLAPVAINRVDDERRPLSAKAFLVEPGVHTVNALVTLDTARCPSLAGEFDLSQSPGMEVNFEGGVTYHVAYDTAPESADEWRLVIWKVEQDCSMYKACLPAEE